MNIVIHCRTNSENVAANKSIDAQAARLKAWAREYEHSIIQTYKEPSISGTSKCRPIFDQMITEAKSEEHPYDAIVVDDIFRFSRRQEHLFLIAELDKYFNVLVISIKEKEASKTGKNVFSFNDRMIKMESDRIFKIFREMMD